MALKIIKADERLKRTSDCVKAVVFGPAGVGKTYQARTLDAKTTFGKFSKWFKSS